MPFCTSYFFECWSIEYRINPCTKVNITGKASTATALDDQLSGTIWALKWVGSFSGNLFQ